MTAELGRWRKPVEPIACLGWGSLTWDPRTLPIRGVWFPDGPLLPIEFARTSSKSADQRVTLVTLPEATPVRTLWCLLAVKNLDEAKQALVEREGITGKDKLDKIGFWDANGKTEHECADAVGRWAAANELAGVVWTELEPTFGTKFEPKLVQSVLKHIGGLNYTDAKHAEEYIRRTPRQIDTECRRAVEKAFGWGPVD